MAPLSAGLLFRLSVPQDLVNITSTIQSDALFTRDIKAKADQAVQDTIVATRIVDGFRNPQQHGAYLKNHASFPLECVVTPVLIPRKRSKPVFCTIISRFFHRITEQMRERLQWYMNTIEVCTHSRR